MADIKKFCEITNQCMDMDISGDTDISDAIRIGPTRADGKPRLLRVTFRDLNMKREVLGKAKLLKMGKFSRVYINPDLTANQRKVDFELRTELKARKGKGETNLVIRRGKIEMAVERVVNKGTNVNKVVNKAINDEKNEKDYESDMSDISMAPLESAASENSDNDNSSAMENSDYVSVNDSNITEGCDNFENEEGPLNKACSLQIPVENITDISVIQEETIEEPNTEMEIVTNELSQENTTKMDTVNSNQDQVTQINDKDSSEGAPDEIIAPNETISQNTGVTTRSQRSQNSSKDVNEDDN